MGKKEYLIYADESHRKGKFFSNFYGGALINYKNKDKLNDLLQAKKNELGFNENEVKWVKVTEQYLNKYIELINFFFGLIKNNKIKIRIMFRQNALVPLNLTQEQRSNEYFLLYYQFIKHAFGLDYCNSNKNNHVNIKLFFDKLPDGKKKNKEFKGHIYALNDFFYNSNVHIYNEDIAEVDSKNHIILQCMDIILGSMNFRLNDLHKEKDPNTNKRGKRTIAKEKLYKIILKNIRDILPKFNVGVSTGTNGDYTRNWKDTYRHWCFKSHDSEYKPELTKKQELHSS